MKRIHQKGDAMTAVVIVLTLALVAALVWIFYQNFTTSQPKTTGQSSSATKQPEPVKEKLGYVDFRKDQQDNTGIELKTVADVEKLENIGQDLKDYMKSDVGTEVKNYEGSDNVTKTYVIDRAYGNYAVGSATVNYYAMMGPKDGKGPIDIIASTQNLGFACRDLEAAKVPEELVDSKCLSDDGVLETYSTSK